MADWNVEASSDKNTPLGNLQCQQKNSMNTQMNMKMTPP
jgi:hypothetical protein